MFTIDADQNIAIVRGDTADIEITVSEIDEHGERREHALVEGDVLTFTVKKNTRTSDVLIQKTGSSIKILPEDTEDLAYGTYKYDVEFTDAVGTVDTIIPPRDFEILEEVTW